MIDTTEAISLYERVEDVYFLIESKELRKINRIMELTRDYFQEKSHHFIVIGDPELSQKIGDDVLLLTKKSLSLFGQWKETELLDKIDSNRQKVVVHFCTENNKLVNKLLKSFEKAIHIGFSNEKLSNFDISFRIKDKDERQLLDQITKYLKQL